MIDDGKRFCVNDGNELIRNDINPYLNPEVVEGYIFVCPLCCYYLREESGYLDWEELLNVLGINPEDIKNFNELSDEDLGKEVARLYKEENKVN